MKFVLALSGFVATVSITGVAVAQTGNSAAGEAVFKRCMVCHKVGVGAKNGMGPALNGVAGRKAAQAPDFNYSPAMKGSKIVWDDATLAQFLAAPSKVVPGTRMTMSFPNPQERSNVIAYLKQFKADGSKK